MAETQPILECENLSISYFTRQGEIPAVVDFNLKVMPGEVVGLVGESGCGKSTVALAIMCYLGKNGRIVRGSLRFMGRDMTAGYEVTEHDAPRVAAIRSTSGPFPIVVRRVVEPHGGGTRVTETAAGGPGGIARVLSPLMKMMMWRTIGRDYRALKAQLEG